jgi:hypothetical protein
MSLEDLKYFPKMDWYSAMEYCNKNPKWILPTKDQMNFIYKFFHKNNIGEFENTYHWTIDELSAQYAWSQNFDTGVFHYYTKLHKNNIILIKNNGI